LLTEDFFRLYEENIPELAKEIEEGLKCRGAGLLKPNTSLQEMKYVIKYWCSAPRFHKEGKI
jgi:hypothetical protein